MTSIMYLREGEWTLIDISGHAGYANSGSDIVCAGISVLSYTLIATSEKAQSEGAYADITAENGCVHILVATKEEKINYALDAIFEGFKLLQESHPEYIQFVDRPI